MTPVVAAITVLRAIDALDDLVDARIYNGISGQHPVLPCVVVETISEVTRQLLRGPDGIVRARVQVESRARTKPVVDAVAAAVHGDGLGTSASGLFGFTGAVGGSPSFQITNVESVGYREDYDADELRQYWVQRDYMIHFRATAQV